ncbi:hypothetical protein A9G11_06430 [Gilliamella sp. wkB108]|uniref:hypothetical protein n=1 Tax=Gilliamella sp. wkB108 TaxID=3120256 RepID=UPI00080DA606|nr:hypothetical protein [Gilliamella apicola]OCG23014.1 hypothetical protein A9G11_06430 [Gilliamella apicola]
MISSIQDIEHAMNSYGFWGILFVILSVFNWFFKNLFPYLFRKSKLEKLDEYKDKFKELNGYSEKTYVIDKIMEEEYGRILLNERDISKQKIMIFLLNYNLCRTIKEAKKFARYLVFRETQKSLVFNKSDFIKNCILGLGFFILYIGLFIYSKLQFEIETNTNFEIIIWLTTCLLSYLAAVLFLMIFCRTIIDSSSTRKLIKKNPKTIQKISSRLSELNTQESIKIERKNLKEKSTVEQTKKVRRKKLKHANAN